MKSFKQFNEAKHVTPKGRQQAFGALNHKADYVNPMHSKKWLSNRQKVSNSKRKVKITLPDVSILNKKMDESKSDLDDLLGGSKPKDGTDHRDFFIHAAGKAIHHH